MSNTSKKSFTRRGFLGLGALTALASSAALAGCAPRQGVDLAQTADAAEPTSGNWVGEAPDINDADIVSTLETEVLIVGAGNGGMACAASCVDLGLDFIICEKNAAVEAARGFFGVVNSDCAKAAGVEVDSLKLLNELSRYAGFKNDPRVGKVWIDESAEMKQWLDGIMARKGLKATLCLHEHNGDGGTDYYIPPISHVYVADETIEPGISLEKAGSLDLAVDWSRNEWLEEYLNEAGHEVTFNHKLVKIDRADMGAVTGAIFETPEGYVRVNASRGVVMATGGYAANAAMTRELNPILGKCITGNAFSPSATGEGIRVAMQAGAQLDAEPAPMIFNRGMVEPGVDAGYTDDSDAAMFSGQIGQNGIGSQPFMKVSRRGRRFINESTPYDNVVFSAAGQEGGVWCMVWDAKAPEDVKRFATIGCSTGGMWMVNFPNVDEWLAAIEQMMHADTAPIKKADTLDELADMLGFQGVDKETFLAQVDSYNTAFDNQRDDEFGKEPYRLSELRTAPFYGAWFGGSLLTTLQGLRIDENMRVLDEESHSIEGLFAVGDCSGSMFANTYPELLVASACGRTLTFGRHVARYLAGDLS
ncbi:FAD-binding protein [Eggerthellaceae bacterium 24-137]